MSQTVVLTCWTCEREWMVHRRRGQYPRQCPTCRNERGGGVSVTQLLARARRAGLVGEVGRLPRFGEVVMVRTPFHAELVHLVDEFDLAWLLVEISNDDVARAV